MRSVRLLTIGALSAALILPTAVLAQSPAGSEFTATITPKAYHNTLTVPVTVRKQNLPAGKTLVGYVVRTTDTLPASPTWLTQPTTGKLPADAVDGEHTFYVWAKAKPGPVITSTPGEGTTFLDRVKPETSGISSSPAEGTITDRAVDITFSYSDPGEPTTGSGVNKYAVVNGTTVPTFGTAAWKVVPNATGPVTVNDHLVSSGNGNKTVSIFVRDRAGNVSTVASLSFTLAIAGPTVTLTAPAYTKALKPGIKAVAKKGGVAISGATYYRTVTNSATPPALPSTPNWRVSVTDATMLAPGDNYVHVWAKDSNGSVSATPATAKVVYDITAPTGVLNLEDGTTTDRTVTVAPTASDNVGGSGVTHWAILNGTAAPASWTPIATPFPSTWQVSLDDGLKTVTLWLKDAAGNISSASETVTLNLADPTVLVVIKATNAYKDGSNNWFTKNLGVAIQTTWTDNAGIGKDNAGYKANLTGATPSTWSAGPGTSINLADTSDGTQTIHSFVKDKNGSIGSDTVQIYLDRTGPSITTFSAPDNTNTRDITLTIAGSDGAGSGIDAWATVVGTTQPDASSSLWLASPDTTVTLPNSDGNHTVTVFARDEVGNVTSDAEIVKLDRVNPSSTLSVVSPDNTRNASITVGGADAGSGIAEYAVVEGTSAPASNDPAWVASAPSTFQVSDSDGSHTISAFTRDAAGNVSSADTETFVLDRVQPTVTFTAPADTTTLLVSITVGGADAGGTGIAKYVVVEDTVAPALNDPAWTVSAPTDFTVSPGLGTKTLTAFTVDNAGNVSDGVSQNIDLIP